MAKETRAPSRPVVVAVPARNEEDRIAACIEALDNQVGARADHVVLLLNNCTDRTAAIARAHSETISTKLHVLELELPVEKANAGHARLLALDAAYKIAGDTGILLTTDADGRVDEDWIEANVAAIAAGAEAVAGWAELDPVDWGSIPLRLHEDDARECVYDALCDELHSRIDPDMIDPWPRHTQASGASIAVTARAYRAAGGIPNIPCGEDRAFLTALRLLDVRIRHAPECRVVVSGRSEGRAVGGMADTIRRRLDAPDRYLDERLEPAEDCARRAALRWLARLVYEKKCPPNALCGNLGLTVSAVTSAMVEPHFGMAWAKLEATSMRLERRRVLTADVDLQQVVAKKILANACLDVMACRRALLLLKLDAPMSARAAPVTD
jgi:glycosyltransferase involved in cell wall biosynthesis